MGSVFGIGAVSSAADATQQEMIVQIKALQAKVDQMQAKQDALDKANQRATAAKVVNDASRHDSLMDVDGFTGGWNTKKQQFFLGSEDGRFHFHPGA